MKTPEQWLEIAHERGKETQPAGKLRLIRDIQDDASPAGVFEIVDVSEGETFYTLGCFLSLADALLALDAAKEPSDLNSDAHHENFAKVEIRERAVGWSGHGKGVYERSWVEEYNEAKDEYQWRRKE